MGDNFAPSFTQKPKLRQEDDGNKLIFDCKLSASPQPSIEWFREDTPVKESSRVKITVKPGKGGNIHDVQLILDDVEEEDAGLYKVKAKNKYGEVSASINLNFSPIDDPPERQIDGLAPTFAQKPVIKQEEGGKHIKFECRILADPRPTITWFRDGLKVQESARCKVTTEKDEKSYFVTMAFTNVTVEDAGKYKVTAKNELGESNATISLNFDTDEVPSPKEGVRPTFTERPSIKQSEDGTSVIFSCRCVANPQPTIVWEFKGKKLREGARHRMKLEPDGKLYYMVILEVNKVTNADEGEYRAVASNKLGEGVATINLHFEGKTASDKPKIPDGKAPRFPKKPEIRQEGDKLVMECILEANPEPEVTWFKGTEIIQEQGRISMYKKICGKDQFIVSVTIMKPEASDGGQWRCNAFNPFGDSNANIALNFEKGKAIPEGFAPTFLDKPSIIPNESGTMITMKVRCKAKPQPTVEWFKDGKKLEAAKRLVIKEHKVTAEMFEYSCIVKDPCGADAGKYKCVAMNQFGEATANVNLNIESDPEPTGQAPVFVEKPTIKFEEKAGRVLMEALVRADPKPTSRWTKDGKELDVARVTATVTKEKDDLYRIRMELRKPQPTDGGVYKCNIKNEFGELNANLNLNIEVAPTIKRPPRIVSVFNRKVVIECVVISTSKPACSWFKDSSKVRLDTRHCVNINEEGEGKYVVQMEMLKAEKMDCGSYKVVAKNEKGETTSQAVELTMDMLEEKEEKKKEEVKEEKREQQEAAQVEEESKKEEKAVK
ncbi:obscurin-like, partial [Procambarus clarkii]|uniref:obscurin-like n=1 Tax=Procambarus clarkii TaxID=6728 RepID=UPI00374250EE